MLTRLFNVGRAHEDLLQRDDGRALGIGVLLLGRAVLCPVGHGAVVPRGACACGPTTSVMEEEDNARPPESIDHNFVFSSLKF
jgi:hypothetical protein